MSFFVFSCQQDESLDPRPLIVEGQYITIDIKLRDKFIDSNNLTTSAFRGIINNPSKNIVKYELYIRRKDFRGNYPNGDIRLFKTITSFPYELIIDTQSIADFYQIDIDNIKQGETYQLVGFSYDTEGNKYGYSNLSRTVQTTASMKQGYRFKTGVQEGTDDKYDKYNNYILN